MIILKLNVSINCSGGATHIQLLFAAIKGER